MRSVPDQDLRPVDPATAGADGPASFGAWAALALIFGALLYAAHAAVVLAGAGRTAGESPELLRWHVADTVAVQFPFALAVAGAAAAIALRGPRLAGIAAPVLFLAAIAGWPVEAGNHVPRLLDARAWAGAAALACALAFLLASAARRIRTPGPALLAAALALAAVVPAAAATLLSRGPPMRELKETIGDLLSGKPAWTVVSGDPKSPPRVGSMTPSLEGGLDGGDLPSLILPPPGEVRFEIPRDVGSVCLRASAGIDRRIRWQLERASEGTVIGFEILVDGAPRFSASMPAHGPDRLRQWNHAGGRDGLPIEGGCVVTLRTTISPPDAAVAGNLAPLAGFGRLELERTVLAPRERATRVRPNIVLVLMDTLRADGLSCYGHAGSTSPALDRLASRGVLYETACATSSWTWPSTASILTGLTPEAHGVVDDSACYLDDGHETLAEALERRGYTTAAFVCNPLLDPVKNFDQGFETYEYAREMRKTDEVRPAIAAWLEANADARFFLYLHLVDTHEPVKPRAEDLARVGASASPPPGSAERPTVLFRPALLRGEGLTASGEQDASKVVPPVVQRWLEDTYSAAVSTADHEVGAILEVLEDLGLEGKTLVAFTSDHGEEFFDHGFLGHDHSLHQELVRVPLILAGPGVPHGVRCPTPVSNAHLAWTLASRGGAALPAATARLDLGAPGGVARERLFFSTEHGWAWNENRTTMLGVEDWPWVMHATPRGLPWGAAKDASPGEGQFRLYDLGADPGERTDLSARRPDVVRELNRKLIEHVRAALAVRRGGARAAGEATREFLKRFGYAGDEDPPDGKPR